MIVATARDAADLLGPHFEGAEEERIAVMHLDSARRLLALDRLTGPSSVHEVELPLRAIVKAALDRNAVGLIVAHNHPSGNPHPSRADIDATRRLAEAAGLFDIRLHDHFIFAGKECRSFRELGLI